MKRHVCPGLGVWASLLMVTAGCAGRQSRIAELSMSFMTKDPDLNAFRVDEADTLIALKAFFKGMTVDEMKQLLGAPTFVWERVAEGAAPAADCDRQYVYRLDDVRKLRADFLDGKLVRLVREIDAPPENGGGEFAVRLPPRPR